ncbi:MAG: class I tRNA ligase family protein [Patescibacteria group bacterium]
MKKQSSKINTVIPKYDPSLVEKKWPHFAKASRSKQDYNPQEIEKKWQDYWNKNKTYQPDLDANPSVDSAGSPQAGSLRQGSGQAGQGKPFYNLMMFPYPSAEGMHVGNMYAFTGSDVYGRFKRMQGHDVFEPIGLDGFGIHSENYALKVGRHPKEQAKISEKNFYRQLHAIGNGFAWDNKVETYDSEYYKWTQWIFTQLFKAGLAYRKKASVNFCPADKTVLADEQVIAGKCERCGAEVVKKDLEQWFFKITDYAERLLNNIPSLDWSEKVKIAQKEWIGRSEGATIRFVILNKSEGSQDSSARFAEVSARRAKPQNDNRYIEVFTTRPDTLHGATFMVLAPEHLLAKQIGKENKEVNNYIQKAQTRTEQERIAEGQGKTGVDTGLFAINPVNGEEIPVWVADYVLMGYGTGAIMAVPAHDTRDYEFAKKYNLQIKPVIKPIEDFYIGYVKRAWSKDFDKFIKELEKLGVRFKEKNKDSAIYEVKEKNLLRFIEIAKESVLQNAWHDLVGEKLIVIFGDGEIASIELFEENNPVWEKMKTLEKTVRKYSDIWEMLYESAYRERVCYLGSGEVINSGKDWEDYFVPDAIPKIIDDLEKKGIGKRKIHYHLRDWLISRQRYWGPPIPLVFCENCAKKIKNQKSKIKNEGGFNKGEIGNPGWIAIEDEDLPVLLPEVKDWKPKGIHSTGSGQAVESPLAAIKDFVSTKCPNCGGPAKRETDVSDTFLDSAWYFFRYISTDNKEAPFSKKRTEKWLPVDMYIGGAEHSVLHLLYSRFITMVFKDLGLIDFEEPFSKFRAHGLLIKEGAKMSKSKGNVVIPDAYIKKFGADTLRLYLMFLGPFIQGGDFYDTGIEGMYRFVKRVWTLFTRISNFQFPISNEAQRMMHKTIKKVTEDLEELRYNTAIASMMEYYNFLAKEQSISKEQISTFIKLISPFAPHVSEELWHIIENQNSVHKASWPGYEEKYLKEKNSNIIVQINGRVRDVLTVDLGDVNDKQKITETASRSPKAQKYLDNRPIQKIIYVPGKIINFVLKELPNGNG